MINFISNHKVYENVEKEKNDYEKLNLIIIN